MITLKSLIALIAITKGPKSQSLRLVMVRKAILMKTTNLLALLALTSNKAKTLMEDLMARVIIMEMVTVIRRSLTTMAEDSISGLALVKVTNMLSRMAMDTLVEGDMVVDILVDMAVVRTTR